MSARALQLKLQISSYKQPADQRTHATNKLAAKFTALDLVIKEKSSTNHNTVTALSEKVLPLQPPAQPADQYQNELATMLIQLDEDI